MERGLGAQQGPHGRAGESSFRQSTNGEHTVARWLTGMKSCELDDLLSAIWAPTAAEFIRA